MYRIFGGTNFQRLTGRVRWEGPVDLLSGGLLGLTVWEHAGTTGIQIVDGNFTFFAESNQVDSGLPVVSGSWYLMSIETGPGSIEFKIFDAEGTQLLSSATLPQVTAYPYTYVLLYPNVNGVAYAATYDDIRVEEVSNVVIAAPPPDTLVSGVVMVQGTAADPGGGVLQVEVRIDDGAWEVAEGTSTWSHEFDSRPFPDGPHTISARSFDGETYAPEARVFVTFDNTAPVLDVLQPVQGALLSAAAVQVLWDANDAGAGIDRLEVSLDGDAPVVLPGTATSTTLTGVADGPHTIAVTAFDRADNFAVSSVAVTVDTTEPTASIVAPTSGAYLGSDTVQVNWIAFDATSGIDHFQIQLDGGAPVTLAATARSHTFTGVTDGSHTVEFRAFDVAGNSVASTVSFTVDVTPPTASITTPTSGSDVASGSVQVTWTASDATSGLDRIGVTVDSGAPVSLPATATSYAAAGVLDGSHTIRVRAIDRTGNAVVVSVTFTVDTARPTVSIASPTTGSVATSSSVTVTWSTSDATSGIDRAEVSVDGGAAQRVSGTETAYTAEGLADGSHTITLIVYDRAGNSASSSVTFRVDTAIFSPSGPYGIAPLAGSIVSVIVAIVASSVALLRHRRKQPPS